MSARPIPGADPGACPDCGRWRKAGLVHECDLRSADMLGRLRLALNHDYVRATGAVPWTQREAKLVLDIAEAARDYRTIALADPTSLDLPSAGSRLDRALSVAGSSDQGKP